MDAPDPVRPSTPLPAAGREEALLIVPSPSAPVPGTSRGPTRLVLACSVLGVEITAVFLGVLFFLVSALRGPVTVPVMADLAVDPLAAGTRLEEGTRLLPEGTLEVEVPDPTLLQSLLAALGQLPTTFLVATLLCWLLRLGRRALRDGAFTPQIADSLTRLGQVVIVGGALAQLIQFCAQAALSDVLSTEGWSASMTMLPLGIWILLGTGCMVLGEIVRAGSGLKAELDEVV
ncbi:MAG: hypothetical protein QG608_3012 [Actinomycetota bacterium]|nr:hypothetical protein [Actinomycetota bacterium]